MKKKKKNFLKSPLCDPQGSYTGVVTTPDGEPVSVEPTQDADDL